MPGLYRIPFPTLGRRAAAGNLNIGDDQGRVAGILEPERMLNLVSLNYVAKIKCRFFPRDHRTVGLRPGRGRKQAKQDKEFSHNSDFCQI